MEPIPVMLVDDNPTFLKITREFLDSNPDIKVIGTANGGEEALTKIEGVSPQIVLVDLAMPGISGTDTIALLRLKRRDLRIIALTVMNTYSFRQAALEAGADVFIPKANMRTELLPALRSLARGESASSAAAAAAGAATDVGQSRVLIMEDDADLARFYAKALRLAGYEVYQAATFTESQALLNQLHFDVLVCDIHLGQDLSTELLRAHAEQLLADGAQIIIVSGHPQYRALCAGMGVDHFLEKPVTTNALITLVERVTARPKQPVSTML